MRGTVVDRYFRGSVDADNSARTRARERGFHVMNVDAAAAPLPACDLVIMRSVNHYLSSARQRQLLRRAFAALRGGGVFVGQINSGPPAACQLRTDVHNMSALVRRRGSRYHFITASTFAKMLRQVGFDVVQQLDNAPSHRWHLSRRWWRAGPAERRTAGAMAAARQFTRAAARLIRRRTLESDLASHGLSMAPDGEFIFDITYAILRGQKRR